MRYNLSYLELLKRTLLIIGNCVALIGVYFVLESTVFKSYQSVQQYFRERGILNSLIVSAFIGLPVMGIGMLFFKKWYVKFVGIIYIFFFTWAATLLAQALV